MSTEQLIADAMALPLSDRVSLAQALWENIGAGLPNSIESAVVVEGYSSRQGTFVRLRNGPYT
jgi:hypothetical protein